MSSSRLPPTSPSPSPSRSPSLTSASSSDELPLPQAHSHHHPHPAAAAQPQPQEESQEETETEEEEGASDSDTHDEADDSSLVVSHPALVSTSSSTSPWPFTSFTQSIPSSPPPTYINNYYTQPQPLIPASSLPHEIVLAILRLLPNSSIPPALLVCKAWCQCGVELLWHKPSLTSPPSLQLFLQILTLSSQSLTTFPYSTFVRRLNLSPLSTLPATIIDPVLEILAMCTRIERLTLGGCKDLSPESLITFLSRSESLVALDLTDVRETNDEVVKTVARSCPKLQGLNLSGCREVTDVGVEAIALGCPALRRMKLRNLPNLTDLPIILLSLSCPLLLELDLIGCTLLTPVSLQQLFRTSSTLRELSLHSCSLLTDSAFPPPSLSLTSLPPPPEDQSLFLTTSLGKSIPKPMGLRYLPPIRTFDHLRYLDLTGLTGLTDDAVTGIVRFMPRIRNLIVAKCTGLTDDAVVAICGLGRHLHYLHMGHVSAITDRAVTKLARACTRLRYIDLACCNLLTDMTVFELATNVPRLKRIGLVRVSNLTDAAIYALFIRPSLERIHLSYCENVTVQSIHELLINLPRLTHLSLTGVPAFRRADLQSFCRAPPKEFNSHQRASFCVYSGKGVIELRRFFRSIEQGGLIPPPSASVLPAPQQQPQLPPRQHRQRHVLPPPPQPQPLINRNGVGPPVAGVPPPTTRVPRLPQPPGGMGGTMTAAQFRTQFPLPLSVQSRSVWPTSSVVTVASTSQQQPVASGSRSRRGTVTRGNFEQGGGMEVDGSAGEEEEDSEEDEEDEEGDARMR